MFASTGYGAGAALLQIVPSGDERHGQGTEAVLRAAKLQNHHGGMVLVGDHLYFGSQHNQGFPACVEFKTGEIKWAEQKGPPAGTARRRPRPPTGCSTSATRTG